MSFENLWPAGSIFATSIFPLVPAMGARLVNWARRCRLTGPMFRWVFPVELGTHPIQRGAEPQVGPNADEVLLVRDGAVQEGLEAVRVRLNDLTGVALRQEAMLERIAESNDALLVEVRRLNTAHTYTVSSTITHQPG